MLYSNIPENLQIGVTGVNLTTKFEETTTGDDPSFETVDSLGTKRKLQSKVQELQSLIEPQQATIETLNKRVESERRQCNMAFYQEFIVKLGEFVSKEDRKKIPFTVVVEAILLFTIGCEKLNVLPLKTAGHIIKR